MKFMIMKYNNTNKVLFAEVELGNYSPMVDQEELESQEEEMTNEVLLVLSNPLSNITYAPQSMEMPIESDDNESYNDRNLCLLDEFQHFMEKCIQDQLILGERMNFQELLLPSWCKVHNAAHSKFECCLHQRVVKHIKGQATPQKEFSIGKPSINNVELVPTTQMTNVGVQPRNNECMIGLKVKEPSKLWMLRFDGSKSKQGVGAGFDLINPIGKTYFATHRLQFYCTNNVV